MGSSAWLDPGGDESFEVLWEDGERVFCRVWREGRDGDRNPVLAMFSAAEHPTPDSLDRLAHEYGLKDDLDGAWAVRPLELVHERGRTMLIMEFPGGEPLDRLIGAPMEVGRFLHIAVALSAALNRLHERGLIHKDIKPTNVLVNAATGQVWLTGFGIASRLPRERQPLEPPEFIAGTLAYMAPEQTGRMNRSVDHRSDLYALGVTLYEMLTGGLPFTAADPMEWVHCHIARQPAPPSERSDECPGPVSAIILKLLAKTAEERYQTAAGAEGDLRRCLVEWETLRRVDEFPLGENDTPDRLLIPEKLYGRASEIETLLSAFDRVVASGKPELVLVSGYSGIGKSAVVNELHKPLVPPRGLFASGKFDQYKRDIPYATLAQAFQSLIRQLLGKPDAELRRWRDALVEAVDPNGRLIVDLVPELKHIIGEQPPVPELPLQDAQGRFQLVLRRLISAFARPEHPLALFLDDLQWLDMATLDFLEDLLTRPDVQHLLLIGAYRDNEVEATHPLMRRLEAMRQAGAILQDIVLAPLTCEDLGQLVADSLHCQPERVTTLAQLIHEKTTGNPFFAIQFITALAEEALLTFDYGKAQWSWDLNRIHAKGYTDNVVDLMVGKLNRLPVETQMALQQLACIGNSAEFALLRMVYRDSEEMHAHLWEAVRVGLIFRSEDSYRFLHDRVQEAAYSLIQDEFRAEAHLRIGRLLAEHTPPEKLEERIFEIVNQLNRGGALIISRDEREQLAELNLIAGKRAKTSAAYASALSYLIAGSALLPDDSWGRLHQLPFQLELHRAECEFLNGQLAAAEERLTLLTSRTANTVELATVTCLRIDLYTAYDQSDRAVAVCLDYLRHLGAKWSPHPTQEEVEREYERIWSQLGSRKIAELIQLPMMSDPASLATQDVLTKVLPPALFTDKNLLSLAICRAVNISLERGNSDASCLAYGWLGQIAGPYFGNYKAAFLFGELGYELVEKRGLKRSQARAYMVFGSHVMPWAKHVRACRELIRRTFEVANKTGDLCFAVYSCINLNTNLLAAGDPLVEAQREAENGLKFAQKARFGWVIDTSTAQLGFIRTLRSLTPKFGSFDDGQFEELRFERHLASDPVLAQPECHYWIRKLQARFLAGDYNSALAALLKAEPLLWTSPSNLELAEYHLYGALCRATSWDCASADQKQQHFEALTAHHRQLEVWAEHCPENFENRAALVGAEIARIEGRELDAERLYEHAIRSAHTNGFVHNEALANELAARFYAARGFGKIAHTYLKDARYGYVRWGADGKVRQLDGLYPHLREEKPVASPTSTIEAPVEHLDLATVLKVSQAVSGEIVLEKLVDTLMRTAIEQAGAERGLLILVRGDDYRIEGEATTSSDMVMVGPRQASITAADLPESVLRYVVHSKESVLLSDASHANPFSTDEYILRRRARSILCLPLLKQTRLVGVLYLENNLTPRVFTPARMAVLELIASGAAISLENTRLYGDLQEREAKMRGVVDTALDAVLGIDEQGRVTEWNGQAETMFGWRREEAVGRRLSETLIPMRYRSAHDEGLRRFLTSGEGPILNRRVEMTALRRNGSEFPVELSVAPYRIGGTWAFSGFVRDVTERKRLYKDLQEREAKFRRLVDSNIIGIFIWGPEGRIIDANEAFLRIVGYDRDDLVSGRLRWSEMRPEWSDADDRRVAELKATGTAQPHELEYIQKGGSAVPVLVGAANFEGGRDEGMGFVIDLTDRKKAEAAARESEARYREVQMALAHANRVATMGQLSASIAHEINQPIAAAITYAKAGLRWLRAQPPELEEVREVLSSIVETASRADDVISRVRALFKKEPRGHESLEINEAILEVIALIRSEAAKNGVSVQTELAERLPAVCGDRVQLQQVILNLLINSIDAMSGKSEGPRELLISTKKDDPDGVFVAVQDSGPGFAPESGGRLFEAFYTTKPDGLGMGLSICRSIIEAHEGRLWATANVPQGAIFQFTLPSHPSSKECSLEGA